MLVPNEIFKDYMNSKFEMFHTFIEYEDIPILYVLTHKDTFFYHDDGFFLCDCVEFREEQIILMTEVSGETLEELVKKSITVYDVLTKRGSGIISIVTRGFETTVENTDPTKVPMPSKTSWLSLSDEEKIEFLSKLNNEMKKFSI